MAVIDLDDKIKQAVQTWRERSYEGTTSPVARRLLEFWFKEEHIVPDLPAAAQAAGSRLGLIPTNFWR